MRRKDDKQESIMVCAFDLASHPSCLNGNDEITVGKVGKSRI